MKLIPRPRYTERIIPFMNKPLIKVITGVRRAGKSALIQLLIDQLIASGVSPENILSINMESLEFDALDDYRKLYDYVRHHLRDTGESYLFVDEVQNVFEWERAIASVLADGLADVTISGSNARLLSSDLATRLTGRYVEIPVYPLLFSEFIEFQRIERNSPDVQGAWNSFVRYGGFPGIHYLSLEDQPVFTYLNSLYNTIVLKDVVNRHEVREPAQLDSITRFLFDNCGNITTAKRITDYMRAQGLRVSLARVQNYLAYLEQAYLVFRCRRYDLKGMRHLALYDKFYLTDIGLRHGLVGYRDNDIAGLLENVVYLELLARGYTVSVGKFRNYEIDFVAERQTERLYVQVSYLLSTEETVDREYRSLRQLDDNHPKLVLSLDTVQPTNRDGIRWQNLVDFLLEGNTS